MQREGWYAIIKMHVEVVNSPDGCLCKEHKKDGMMDNQNLVSDDIQQINGSWYEQNGEFEEHDTDYAISEYDIISSPNDFNIKTLFDMIDSGVIAIPGFQRNYVWDIKRASKLIESLIIGLPIPQIFLYGKARNKFLVIDGQQRLMTIYYFIKERFPKKEKRTELRQIFNEHGAIPADIVDDDRYFSNFKLSLPEKLPGKENKFNKATYSTLGEHQSTFNLRTVRCIMVQQVAPDGDAAIYEIFNRLNTGGVNLSQQEIRMSLYHSPFYEMLYRANTKPEWRKLLGVSEADLHMKDLEFLLRGFALLINGNDYKPSMVRFLNGFSKQAQQYSKQEVSYLETLMESFFASCADLSRESFQGYRGRFSFMLFESVFVAVCRQPYADQRLVRGQIVPETVTRLKKDADFLGAAQKGTASKENVRLRLQRAQEVIRVQ